MNSDVVEDNPKRRVAWNKGLTKETDSRVAIGAEKMSAIAKARPRSVQLAKAEHMRKTPASRETLIVSKAKLKGVPRDDKTKRKFLEATRSLGGDAMNLEVIT